MTRSEAEINRDIEDYHKRTLAVSRHLIKELIASGVTVEDLETTQAVLRKIENINLAELEQNITIDAYGNPIRETSEQMNAWVICSNASQQIENAMVVNRDIISKAVTAVQ